MLPLHLINHPWSQTQISIKIEIVPHGSTRHNESRPLDGPQLRNTDVNVDTEQMIKRGTNLQKAGVAVVHKGCFAMHDTAGSAHHPAAKHLPDALVAHAHPKHRKLWPQLLYYLQGDP